METQCSLPLPGLDLVASSRVPFRGPAAFNVYRDTDCREDEDLEHLAVGPSDQPAPRGQVGPPGPPGPRGVPGAGPSQSGMGLELQTVLTSLAGSMNVLADQKSGRNTNMRAPQWQFHKLEERDGRVSTLAYFNWKDRLLETIERLNIPEATAVNVLQNSNTIPLNYRAYLSFCSTLQQIWTRLEQVFPHKSTTLKQLVDSVVARPPSADGNTEIVARCNELLAAIELLVRIHPNNRLTRTEALACLGSLGGTEITGGVTSVIERFDQGHAQGQTYEQLLHAFFTRTRKVRLDLVCAQQLYRTREAPGAVHLLTTSTTPPRSSTPPPHYPPRRKEEPASSKAFAGILMGNVDEVNRAFVCLLCNAAHKMWKCPDLANIKFGDKDLPKEVCPRCLRPRGSIKHAHDCCIFKDPSGKRISTLCNNKDHPCVHFKICKSCGQEQRPRGGSQQTNSLGVKVTKDT